MSPRARFASLLLILFATAPAFADPKPAAPTTKDQIASWIKQLGDGDFEVRQKASQEIWNATDDDTTPFIEEALKDSLKSKDAESVRRASEILERLQLGINAKTPKKIVDLVERFHSTKEGWRQVAIQDEAIKGLFESGAPGQRVILRLIDAEEDPLARNALAKQVATKALIAIPGRMADGDRASVEALLDLSLHTDQQPAQLSYAAYWFRRGKLGERIRMLEAMQPTDPERHAALLATVYRVHGDYPKARAAAEKLKNPELLNAVLFDQGDWKELAARTAKTAAGSTDPDVLGLLALYQRLAGDPKGTAETLMRVRENAKHANHEQPARALLLKSARSLLLNDRPDEALSRINQPRGPVQVAELLCARYQIKDAMKAFDADGPREPTEPLGQFEVLRARTMFLLGDHDAAVTLFKHVGEKIGHSSYAPGTGWSDNLAILLPHTELKLGLKELAFEHTAMAAVHYEKGFIGLLNFAFAAAFPDRQRAAAVWWRYLRHKYADDDPTKTMKRVREILDGRTTLKEFTPLAEDALQPLTDLRDEWDIWVLGLADSCQDAGADGLFEKCLEKANEAIKTGPKTREPAMSGVLIRLGDFYAAKKNWTRAAEQYAKAQYAKAWEKDHENLPAYLRGLALIQAGKENEGKRLIELAHDLPFADPRMRYACALELEKRGHADLARLEWTVHLNGIDDFYTEPALLSLAQHAHNRKNYATCAAYYERYLVCHLSPASQYFDTMHCLFVPAAVHSNRAMAFLTANNLADAQREIQTCLDILPGDINLAVLVVPELEKRGHKKEAADLFAKVWAVHEGVCKDYPKSAWGHNNAAWLAVRCRRNLDEALQHAKRAVELAPEQAGYLDTLAEVYFQKGDKAKALELAKKCLQLDLKNAHFQRQLKRIEAGDPSVDVPD